MERVGPPYGGAHDHLGRRGQTDVAAHEGQPVRALELVLLSDFARVTQHVVAAIEEQVSHRGTDSLRGSRHNDGLLFRSHMNLPILECGRRSWGSNHPPVGTYCRAAHPV